MNNRLYRFRLARKSGRVDYSALLKTEIRRGTGRYLRCPCGGDVAPSADGYACGACGARSSSLADLP